MGYAKLGFFALMAALLSIAQAMAGAFDDHQNDPRIKKYVVGDKATGYVFSTRETRDFQDDDFTNPAFVWVDMGIEQWSKIDGSAKKSCAQCHGDAETSMKGVSARYPVYSPRTKKMMALPARINECRTERMGAKAWKWESDEMLGTSAYVALQSRGMPLNVSIDGPAKPFFEQGKAFYYQRRGQMDLACKHCHEDNPGKMIRADLLSYGMPNGFPTYRLKWQKIGSLHRRFRGCNKNIRSIPQKQGSEDYTNLELYIAWRAEGAPSEAPSVRR